MPVIDAGEEIGTVEFPEGMSDAEMSDALSGEQERIDAARTPSERPVLPSPSLNAPRMHVNEIPEVTEQLAGRQAQNDARMNEASRLAAERDAMAGSIEDPFRRKSVTEDYNSKIEGLGVKVLGPEPTMGEALSRPLVTMPRVSGQDLKTLGVPSGLAEVAAGVQKGIVGATEFFTSPLGVATLGMGSLPEQTQQLISGVFATDMAAKSPQLFAELGKAIGSGDKEKASELALAGVLNVYFAGKSLEHGAGGNDAIAEQLAGSGVPIVKDLARRDLSRAAGAKLMDQINETQLRDPDLLARAALRAGFDDDTAPFRPAPAPEPEPVEPVQPVEQATAESAKSAESTEERQPLLDRKGVWEASTPREGNRVRGIWTVADAGELVSSADRGFDQNLQPRDRTRAASGAQIAEMVRGFEPERLGDSPTTDLGAPIIDERNQVLSGNGRVSALRQIYGSENRSKADAYRTFILKQAEASGMPADVIAGIKKMEAPVLVRQVSDFGEISKEQFARESNQQQVLGMGEAEKAANDAQVAGKMMDLFRPSEEGDVMASSNREFLKAFVKGTGDEAELMTKDGFNTAALTRRVRNAVLARVLGANGTAESRTALGALMERADELNLRTVANGLMNAAPALVKLAGTPYDLAPVLNKAIADLVRVKTEGVKLEDFLGQIELLTDPTRSSETDFVLERLAKAKTVKGVVEPLVKYAERAGKLDAGTGDIFGGAAPRRGELLKEAYSTAKNAKAAEQPEFGTKAKAPAENPDSGKTYKVFQGRGNTAEEIYGKENVERGAGVPLFGKGEYYAFQRENAEAYGKVTPHTVTLRNPYLLDSDAKWFALLRDAKAPHLNNMAKEHYTEPEKIPAATERVQQYLKKQGYDGIEVRLAEGSDQTRRLSAMAGHEQVVRFAEAPTAKTGDGGSLATFERATLPRRIEGKTGAAAGGSSAKPMSLAEIRQYLSKALDIPVRLGLNKGGVMGRALGLFRVKPETIRMKALNDLPTLAHEIGHYLHFILFPKGGVLTQGNVNPKASDFAGAYDRELMALGAKTSLPTYKPQQVRMEGVAEFVREWMMDRTQALAKAPGFAAFFEQQIGTFPEVWKILERGRMELGRYINAPAEMKLESRISRDEKEAGRTPREFWNEQVDDWVNELAPIERALDRLEEFGLPAGVAKQVNDYAVNYIGGWRGKVEHALYQRQIDYHGNDVGPSLREVLGGVENVDEFERYLVGARELELARRGIETGMEMADAPDQRRWVSGMEPKYGARAKALYEWQRNNLKLLVDAGIISPESFGRMVAANEFYVPFFRVMERVAKTGTAKGEGFINLSQGVHAIKGSDRQYIRPLESVLKNAYLFRDLAERNRVARAFAGAVEMVRGGGRVAEGVAAKVRPVEVSGEEVAHQLKAAGIEVPEGTAIEDLAFKVWRAARQQSAADGRFTVWETGKERVYQVDDEHLYRALALADSNDAALFAKVPGMKMLRGFTRLKRAGAMLTLEFMARNPFRDQLTAAVFSKHGFVPFVDGFRGALSALGKDQLYWDWVKSGGRYSDFVAGDRKDLQAALADVIKDPTVMQKAMAMANPLNAIRSLQKVSEIMEQATRLAEFRRAKEAGASDVEAANASKDVTLNFSRAGFKGKLVNQLIAFFNAGMQDLSKFARAHQERPLQTTLKALMYISAPSVLSWWLGRDDEAIQRLPEWRRAFFWNVNLRELADRAGMKMDDFVLSVPKPFLLGQIYGTSFERGLDYAHGKDPNAVKKWMMGLWEATPLTVANLIPSAALPLVENYANRSFFKNSPLENQSMQNLPTELRYGPGTSLVARKLGELTAWAGMGISPVKIDNLAQGWFAGLGKYGMEAADALMMKLNVMDVPPEPAKSIWERPLLKGFKGSPYEASAYLDRFYNGLERAEQRVNGVRTLGELDPKEAKRFIQQNREAMAFYFAEIDGKPMITQLREGRAMLGEVVKAMKMVQASRELNPEAKREKLLSLTKTRDRLAEGMFKVLLSPQDRAAVY